jgi:hypothetical protein
MLAQAVIVHDIPGRTRLRIAERRQDGAYFRRVEEDLRKCQGVTAVMTNVVTGSVLVLHDAQNADRVIAHGRMRELFELVARPAAVATPHLGEVLVTGAGRLDAWVRRETNSGTTLKSVALGGLLFAGLWQSLRGRWLPEAVTLFWYALTMAGSERDRGASDVNQPQRQRAANIE